jgi:hypothetical protein
MQRCPPKAGESLAAYDRDSVIEFLKTLQVLTLGTHSLVIREDQAAAR